MAIFTSWIIYLYFEFVNLFCKAIKYTISYAFVQRDFSTPAALGAISLNSVLLAVQGPLVALGLLTPRLVVPGSLSPHFVASGLIIPHLVTPGPLTPHHVAPCLLTPHPITTGP